MYRLEKLDANSLRGLVKKDPRNADALAALANRLAREKKHQEAISMLARLVFLFPPDARPTIGLAALAFLHLEVKQYARASDVLHEGLMRARAESSASDAADAELGKACSRLARVAYTLDEHEEVIQLSDLALEHLPESDLTNRMNVWKISARALKALGRDAKASEAFHRADELRREHIALQPSLRKCGGTLHVLYTGPPDRKKA